METTQRAFNVKININSVPYNLKLKQGVYSAITLRNAIISLTSRDLLSFRCMINNKNYKDHSSLILISKFPEINFIASGIGGSHLEYDNFVSIETIASKKIIDTDHMLQKHFYNTLVTRDLVMDKTTGTLHGLLPENTASITQGKLLVHGYFQDYTELLELVKIIKPNVACLFGLHNKSFRYPLYIIDSFVDPLPLSIGGKKKKIPHKVVITTVKGKGDYTSAMNNILNEVKKIGRPLVKQGLIQTGAMLGSKIHPFLGQIGAKIGSHISKIIGSGDYTMTDAPHTNSLFPKTNSLNNAYAMFGNERDATVVMHRSFIQDLYSGPIAGQFNIESWYINPGLSTFDPLLSSIAQNYEVYSVAGMVVTFVSSCSEYITGTALGTIIIAMEYNASAPVFTNKTQMENSDFAVSARLDKDIIYGIECKDQPTSGLYIRTGNTTLPLTTTDLGLLQIATAPSVNVPINTVLGEIWVSYHVLLRKPRITIDRFGYAHFITTQTFPTTGNYPNISYSYLDPSYTPVLRGNLYGCEITTNTITFPDAKVGDTYLITTIGTLSNLNVTLGASIGTNGTYALNGLQLLNFAVDYTRARPSEIETIYYTSSIGDPSYYTVLMVQITSNSTPPSLTYSGNQLNLNGTNMVLTMDIIITSVGNGLTSTNY
jgi:hypothetical protein